MEIIKYTDTFNEFQKKAWKNRRMNSLALAIMKRAKASDIPEAYLRIGKNKFLDLLDTTFHNDINSMSAVDLANYIYDNPVDVMKKYSFIIIDGGDRTNVARKVAGFALLFRFIACDKNGKYVDCSNLVHKVQSISFDAAQEHRNDVCQEHKGYDALFISECLKDQFRTGWESGMFVNEILEYRDDYKKPTIISFMKQLPSKQMTENKFDTADFGRMLCILSGVDQTPMSKVLRIRVKDMREWKNE